MRELRIVHLITLLELGGAQQNTIYSCRSQAAAGHRVWLLSGAGGILDDDAASLPGVERISIKELVHPLSPLQDLAAVRCLTSLFKELKPDIIHTHSSKAGFLGRLAAHRAGVSAVVHTVHGWSFHPEQNFLGHLLYRRLERVASKWCRFLITVSDHDRATGLRFGIGKRQQYRTIRSGIDWPEVVEAGPRRAAVREQLGVAPEETMVLMVACLKPQKAPLDFVKVAAAVPDAIFFIAGDGRLRADVERAAQRLGISDRVRLLGWRRDVPELVQAADILVLTSRWEGLPRAVVEAVAAGTPVVATDTGGIREVIRPMLNGILVPPGDTAALAGNIKEVICWPRTNAARSERAALTASALRGEFDLTVMADQLLSLYGEVLA